MRSSDWSSDVCSSDLYNDRTRQFLPELADAMVAGVPFETIVRRGGERGVYADAPGRKDRKSVVQGKSVSGSVDLGGRRPLKQKKTPRQTRACTTERTDSTYTKTRQDTRPQPPN